MFCNLFNRFSLISNAVIFPLLFIISAIYEVLPPGAAHVLEPPVWREVLFVDGAVELRGQFVDFAPREVFRRAFCTRALHPMLRARVPLLTRPCFI